MRTILRRWARRLLAQEMDDEYWRGWRKGKSERPLDPCGLRADEHCVHSYMYDPGQ